MVFASALVSMLSVSPGLGAQTPGVQTPSVYVSGAGGPTWAGSIVSLSGNTNIQTHVGPVGLLALGYRFGNGLRLEVEGDYRSSDVDAILTRRVNGLLLPMYNVGGAVKTYGVMVNALYDLPVAALRLPFRPYVGAGVGYSYINFSGVTGTEPFNFPANGGGPVYSAPGTRTNTSGGTVAYQFIAGVSAPLSVLPGVEATLEYRYFGTGRVTTTTSTHADVPLPPLFNPNPMGATQNVVRDQTLLFGLRYTFAKPPAKPPI
jgi:opacity protein-like surface antigen